MGDRRSEYCVVSNFIRAKRSVGPAESVTLTTQGTAEFLRHIEEVCRRWQGPVSLAVYAPGTDYEVAGRWVAYLRNCRSNCVSEWVTWHLVFDSRHPPNVTSNSGWKSDECREESSRVATSYVSKNNLAYPINVARNVAMENALTEYVFASDIELYPSANIVPRFLKLLATRDASSKREAFVLPVFEISSVVKSPPTDKRELLTLYKAKKAVSFHRFMCNRCHKIPNLDRWLLLRSDDESLGIFETTKRDRVHGLAAWEPFFLSKTFPKFDERLTWNGKSNKMQVALEMCFMDYDFHIVDNAFLVHAPGIKRWNPKKEMNRSPYVKKTNKLFREIRHRLKDTYSGNHSCF